MKVSKFKKICIVTGNRAEYGLLRNLIIKLNKTNSIMLYLIITGTHLSKKYGNRGCDSVDCLQDLDNLKILKAIDENLK